MARRVFVAMLCTACAAKPSAPSALPQHESPTKVTPMADEGPELSPFDANQWQLRLLAEHPLVGKIFASSPVSMVAPKVLLAALSRARFVLLGEKHDNPDHHRVQAFLLNQVLTQRRDVAVAFEMFDSEQQNAIDAVLLQRPNEPDALASAVDWQHSGWPDWSMYRQLFAVAIERHGRIIAANLSRERARGIVRGGAAASPIPIERLPVLSKEQSAALEAELAASHCGMLPEPVVRGMALAQRVRDFTMAERLSHANNGAGAVLIAGGEHVRKDRGVPLGLTALNEDRVLSIAMIEVQRGEVNPSEYLDVAGSVQPFDFVIFTPRVDEDDPCAAMRSGG